VTGRARPPARLLAVVIPVSAVGIGAYVAATGMVSFEALDAAVAESLPSYRTQHVALNVAALAAGRDAVPTPIAPAWREEVPA